ncbi:hypothetical protein N7466_007791 [Penicillium verhagenii]|uniref:uncharacterized protein n=1 Tax=Penicillium verhagenii TaxID=1562060 RepID=UPI0025457395|nr:uncharacterized protein N7466_007791 [Penicillium verhagenii]KAJ5928835.1 hypothetical protein N7466_007791 [Penicillium verhagenii]
MNRDKRFERPPETPQAQFQTPSRPTTRVSKSTTASKRIASPRILGSVHPRKRDSLPNPRVQSTLTQIDFVTQTTQLDDEGLEYLDNSGLPANTHEPSINEGSDDNSQQRSTTRTRPTPTVFEKDDDHPKRRRKSVGVNGRGSEPSHSIRKSQAKRKPTEKPPTKRDKTLTQMDFVRRYIPIDDEDNDMNLGYIQPTFQRSTPRTLKKEVKVESMDLKTQPSPTSARRNRRVLEAELDLSTGEPISDAATSQAVDSGNTTYNGEIRGGPVTPLKRKLEIQSSQSPESPGLAIITSSQFRSATRSPLRQKAPEFARESENSIKEESPQSQQLVEDSQGQWHVSPEKTPTAESPKGLIASTQHPTFGERLASCAPPSQSTATPRQMSNDQEPKRTQRERTVVYETDAETDQSESEDSINEGPTSPPRLHESQICDTSIIQHDPWSHLPDDSQELPLPGVHSSDNQDYEPLSEAPMSDASAYYQRRQPATQFPHEPIPRLSTQRLRELFPNEGCSQHPNSGSAPPPTGQKFHGPFLQTQTQQSQDGEDPELVPESSPAQGQENDTEESQVVFQRPRLPESIQVESSQVVDRAKPRAGGLLSRTQLLTSSLMESVPLPDFWMGSQDSVGEPYSLPD